MESCGENELYLKYNEERERKGTHNSTIISIILFALYQYIII